LMTNKEAPSPSAANYLSRSLRQRLSSVAGLIAAMDRCALFGTDHCGWPHMRTVFWSKNDAC
jgi:hypothetical protein